MFIYILILIVKIIFIQGSLLLIISLNAQAEEYLSRPHFDQPVIIAAVNTCIAAATTRRPLDQPVTSRSPPQSTHASPHAELAVTTWTSQ